MKRINSLILCVIILHAAWAQEAAKIDTTWKKGGFVSLSFNQVSLTNWAAGGQNALSGTFIGSFFANYKKGKTACDNTLDIGYGLIKSGDASVRKNEDKFEFNSKYGREAKGNFFYSALVNAKTQFAPGYNYPDDSTVISRFAAPAYINIALGVDYKPTSYFSLFISPATGRSIIVTDQKLADAGQFGVDPATYDANGTKLTNGKQLRVEFGAYLRARFQKEVFKNVTLLSTLNLFNNYTSKNNRQRNNIYIDWQTMLNIKAGKLVTFSVFTHVLYDNIVAIPIYGDVTVGNTVYKNVVVGKGPRTQFKEVLGLGLSYKF